MKDETHLRGWIILSCTHKMRISPRRWRQSTSILYSKEWKEVKNFMDEWQKSFSIRKTYKNWCFCFFFHYYGGFCTEQAAEEKKKFDRFLRYFFYMYVRAKLSLRKEKKVPCRFCCELFFFVKIENFHSLWAPKKFHET